jgi:putative ABC transport system permease protein
MWNEIKVALRGLAKTPGFTAIAILTVALAMGANSAVFSLINAVLVRPLPYHDPARLVLLWEQFAAQGLERIPVSAPEYNDFEKDFKSVEQIATFDYTTFNLAAGGTPERISGAKVSPALFQLLGTDAIRGRTFAREEQGEGHDDVIVISERLWNRRFNADPSVIGKTLLLNGRSYTVIGIMPKTFEFPIPLFNVQGGQFAERVDIWKPIAFSPAELKARYSRSYGVIARLRDGATAAVAQSELNGIVANWRRLYPDNYPASARFGAVIYPLQGQVVGSMRTGLVILLGAVAFVLLIACANLATMLLARASGRERELAIRIALGAGSWRVLRQLLTESVILSVAGGSAGLLLSVWGLDLLKRVGARTIPRLTEVNLDWTVLLVTALVSVATGILFGLIPALVSAKPELTEALKEGGRGSTSGIRRNRIRNSLVVSEIALALVLLVGAGLLMKSFVRLQNVNPGFNPHKVLTMEISLPPTKYSSDAKGVPGESTINFFAEAQRRIAQLPGVEANAFTTVLPLSGANADSSFSIEGADMKAGGPGPDEELRDITPDYFRVLQTPLIRGRFFSENDTATSPKVAIINEALARKYWPGKDPLGQRITFSDPRKPDVKWIPIVGIVGNIRHRGLDVDAQPEYYIPNTQDPSQSMLLAVRSAQDPLGLAAAIRREIQSIDSEQPVANVRTFDTVVADSVAPRRLSVVLLGAFAAIALLLAAVGTYGVISYLVVQRTHELGVRMALGAQRRDLLTLVVGHAFRLVIIGLALGLVLAFASARSLSALLYDVGVFDPVTFLLVPCVLGTVALLASYIPALRATRADPMIALTHNG